MINIDLQNKIFHIKEPTNKDEYQYLESEVLIMVGAFLNYQETFHRKCKRFFPCVCQKQRSINDNHNSKSKGWQW